MKKFRNLKLTVALLGAVWISSQTERGIFFKIYFCFGLLTLVQLAAMIVAVSWDAAVSRPPARPFFQESGPQRPIRLSALLLGRTETEWRLLLADAGRLASMFEVPLQNAGTMPSPILPADADYAEMMARQVAPMADVYVYFLDQKHGNILRNIEARTDQTAHDRDTETLAFAYMGRRVIYMLGRTGDGAAQDLLHELGHVMMLEHHERRNDIMFWCAGQYRLSFSPDFEYRLKYWNFR